MVPKTFKKILVLVTLAASLFATLSVATVPVSSAKSIGDDLAGFVDGLFSGDTGTGVVTFTDPQFKGGLKPPTPEGYDSSLTQIKSGREFVVKVVNYALGFLGLFATLMVIYGGFLYVSSAGESEGPEKGKKTIMYAVIGIIIIFGSYAIVNTVLKAPGGNQAAQPDGSAAPQFAGGPQYGRNIQATRVYNLATYTISAYQGYSAANLALEGISQNQGKFWDGNAFTSESDATNALNQIVNGYASNIETLRQVVTKSASFTGLADMVDYQQLYVKNWIEARKQEISKVQSYPVNTGSLSSNSGYSADADIIISANGNEVNTNDGSQGVWSSSTKHVVHNCSVDSPLSQPSNAQCIQGRFGEYQTYFTDQYSAFAAKLQNGTYEVSGLKIDIGNTQMKAQAEKDFESQMDFAQNELISIENSSKSWPTDAVTYFGQLKGTTAISAGISSGQSVFAKLKAEKKNPIKSKENLKTAVLALGQLYETLKDLQGVDVKLTASAKEGNAPLIVTFSTVGSSDPSNKTIQDGQISWDLDGNGFDVPDTNCSGKTAATASCVYKKPGTYKVGVKIKSQSDNMVEGIRYMDVKVNPPRARFAIKLVTTQNNTKQEIPITDYDKDGLLKIDRDRVQLAYSDVSKGLKFNATGTVSGEIIDKSDKNVDVSKKTQETIQRMKWVFGDGTSVDDSPAENPSIMQVDHTYSQRGTYQVVLEVTGKDGVVDRKLFNVTVADISAIIYVVPGYTNKVNTPITFNSAVTSDGSKVAGYEWTSTPDNTLFLSKNPNFSAAPDQPGHYTVMLKVKNESNSEASDKVDIDIESNPPVAKFSAKVPKTSKPAEVVLDGSESYDPDGPNPNIMYTWSIGGEIGKDFTYTQGMENDKVVKVLFLTTGDHKVQLKVEDSKEKGKTSKADQTIKVASLLDADWVAGTQTSAVLDTNGQAAVTFGVTSGHGTSYSFDYGDGEVEDGIFQGGKTVQGKHVYKKSGIFSLMVTVQDDQGATVKLNKKIAIGSGSNPVAANAILLNGEEIDTAQQVIASRKDVFTFDATSAKNTDGTVKNLEYTWDFGDGKKSTKSVVNYSYKDLSPKDPGYYTVTLTISDKTNPTKKSQSSFQVNIVPQKPALKTITVIPMAAEMKTPLKVQLKAVDARAPEGQITTYRWWYYDSKDNTNEMGAQLTTVPETTITLGTKGDEGQEVTYVFQVELRDNENQTVTAGELLGEENLPTLKVVNGPNKPPKASFTVSKTSVQAGETITFTSASTDSDGKIASYVWDLDGDGFQNDQSTTKSSVSKTYTTASPDGIKVRLKVIDDSYAEATSDSLTVYVTSQYAAPKAAFYYQQKPGTLQVAFQNASTVDKSLTLASTNWDFDTLSLYPTADTNNDGIKSNDVDSQQKDALANYQAAGTYYVKLTVQDSGGGIATVTTPITVKPIGATSNGGAPSFSLPSGQQAQGSQLVPLNAKMNTIPAADPVDGKIHLTGTGGNVTIDFSPSEGPITKYVIDKNIYFDSNNDGIKDNDENYMVGNAGQWTTDFQKAWGKDAIKLTVYNAAGQSSSAIREIIFDAPLASGANNIFVIPGAYELYGSLASMFGFGILTYRNKKRKTQA
ncbi:MAG: PKD domain-containing protein [Candidatus Gracilibacteria bacterium]